MISYRKATISDVDLFYQWINDPDVRKSSFTQAEINYKDHVEWFNNALSNEAISMLVFEKEKSPFGQGRVTITEGVGIISFSIAKEYRGQKLSTKLLLNLADYFFKNYPDLDLVGYVKAENRASKRAFIAAGFKEYAEDENLKYVLRGK